MRRIAKGLPPSNVSPAGQVPCSLKSAERELLKTLPTAANKSGHARGRYERLEKSSLRRVMYVEQGALCVFCERRVKESSGPPVIDHWIALSRDPGRALDWRNLYLSCPTFRTCDSAKGDLPLRGSVTDPELGWPSVESFERYIGYSNSGDVYVRSDVKIAAGLRSSLAAAIECVVVLNHPSLREARKAVMNDEGIPGGPMVAGRPTSRSERNARARQHLTSNPLPDFVSARVACLRGALGKGR